jgi:glycerol-3-phosphate cytidylyltransferase
VSVDRGLAIGVFDLFHVGHLRYLQYARRQCRELVVAVTPDHLASRVKGRKPVIPQDQRMEIVRGLGFVAQADLLPASTEDTEAAAAWISDWNVQQVVAGGSWHGSERWGRLAPALAACGVSVQFAPHTDAVSTTLIIETVLEKIGHGGEA